MVRVNGLGRYEEVPTFVCHDSDGVPPRLNIRSVDILDDTRDREVIDCAPIRSSAVVPRLRTKFWQRAGRALVLPTVVHVLLLRGILWRTQVAFQQVELSLGAPVLFLLSLV
jgi:hypothetical protein